MNRVLIVCMSPSTDNGGNQCINRNIESITEIFGLSSTYVFRISNKVTKGLLKIPIKLIDVVSGYYYGLDHNKIQKIIEIIKEKQIDTIYIDGSFFGKLAKIIKSRFSTINVITFFHNCEFDYSKSSLIANNNYLSFYNPLLAYRNERNACKYSDEIIVLNNRDAKAIKKYYGISQCQIIPITFKPWYEPSNENQQINNPLHAVFVGSYFYGNTVGLKWFCSKVLPFVNIQFTIVGSGMEKLLTEIPYSDKLKIKGRVEDLTEVYEEADFVLLPILSGGGMKVKTAESLMFGKYIVGTPEAFIGYDINSSIASVCETEDDFINVINNLHIEAKYNKPSRDLFDTKYSYNHSLNIFKKIFNRN